VSVSSTEGVGTTFSIRLRVPGGSGVSPGGKAPPAPGGAGSGVGGEGEPSGQSVRLSEVSGRRGG
jgi:hypothetical protein